MDGRGYMDDFMFSGVGPEAASALLDLYQHDPSIRDVPPVAVAESIATLRETLLEQPPPELRERHLEALVTAMQEEDPRVGVVRRSERTVRDAPARRLGGRRRALALVLAAVLVLVAALGTAGALPGPIQTIVEKVAEAFGVDLSDGGATSEQSDDEARTDPSGGSGAEGDLDSGDTAPADERDPDGASQVSGSEDGTDTTSVIPVEEEGDEPIEGSTGGSGIGEGTQDGGGSGGGGTDMGGGSGDGGQSGGSGGGGGTEGGGSGGGTEGGGSGEGGTTASDAEVADGLVDRWVDQPGLQTMPIPQGASSLEPTRPQEG